MNKMKTTEYYIEQLEYQLKDREAMYRKVVH